MKPRIWIFALVCAIALGAGVLLAQKADKGQPFGKQELASLIPDRVFVDGQSPTVQKRNAGGARMEDGKVVLAMLVDTAGYSSEFQEKYIGVLLTQGSVYVNAKMLKPGAYAFGRKKSGGGETVAFYDVGGNPVIEVQTEKDDKLRPVMPLQLREGKNRLRLYLGRVFVKLSSTKE